MTASKRSSKQKKVPVEIVKHPLAGFLLITEKSAGNVEPAVPDSEDPIPETTVAYHGHTIVPMSSSRIPKKRMKECTHNADFTKKLMYSLLPTGTGPKPEPIVDTRFRDQVFWPTMAGDGTPVYLYPTLSIPKNESNMRKDGPLPKVEEFVLASCLFGGSIFGVDGKGEAYPLIDHRLEVNDFITRVEVDKGLHPYELMVFATFETILLPLMHTMSGDDFTIRYHVPEKDYMLYGIRLFIQGIMGYHALITYIREVKKRAEQHRKIIQQIADRFKVKIKIESPFDNLFPPNQKITAETILEVLSPRKEQVDELFARYPDIEKRLGRIEERNGYQSEENEENEEYGASDSSSSSSSDEEASNKTYTPTPTTQFLDVIRLLNTAEEFAEQGLMQQVNGVRKGYEEFFVDNLLRCLATNNHLPEHQAIWRKIITQDSFEQPQDLERIFQIANTVLPALACSKKRNSKVCLLLPNDEKPIFTNYATLRKRFGEAVGLFWLPPILSSVTHPEDKKNPHNQDNLFRFRPHQYVLDPESMKARMTEHFKLSEEFWKCIDNASQTSAPTSTSASPQVSPSASPLSTSPPRVSALIKFWQGVPEGPPVVRPRPTRKPWVAHSLSTTTSSSLKSQR